MLKVRKLYVLLVYLQMGGLFGTCEGPDDVVRVYEPNQLVINKRHTTNDNDVYDTSISDMDYLKHNYPIKYEQRKAIIEERAVTKMNEYGVNIICISEDNNCLINAYLQHVGEMSEQNALDERQKLNLFMNGYLPNDNTDKYMHGDVSLKTLHQMNQINILVFEYHVENDQISQHYYHNPKYEFKQCLSLLYFEHTKHYNYCVVENVEGFTLPTKAGYYYNTSGTKYHALTKIDNQIMSDIKQIEVLNDHDKQYSETFSGDSQNIIFNDKNNKNKI
eukprot:41267_1